MATASPEPAASTAPVTVVTQTRVAAGHDAEFSRWQEEVNGVLAGIPGYLDHSVIPPNPPAQVDWVIVQRFKSAEAARGWLQSEQRLRLLEKIQPLLIGQDDVHLFEDDSDHKVAAPVTTIISHRVLPGKEAAFVEWQRRIAAVEATFEGFSGYRFEPPVPGVQDDWVTMLRFDSDAHLDAWLNSEQRQQLLKETPDFSPEFHVRKVKTGFDSWFTAGTRPGAEPPAAWKQNMVVLLVLYPTVFLFGFFVGTPFLMNRGVPFWLTLFLSNAASTILLGYWFTPQVSRALMWWLSPTRTSPPWTNWAGAGLVALLYGLCLLVFSQFP
jgi:antibiotic biosynthesis monooxygenase (ABM) superfamily enzyme